MRYFLYTLSFLQFFVSSSQNEGLFEEGNALYNEGKYTEAIDKYTLVLQSGNHSGSLYFNLGNCNYKLNKIAHSIFYYEKALQLVPDDPDVTNNIAFARNMTIDTIDVLPEAGLSKFVKNVAHSFNFDTWARTSVILVLIAVVLFIIYYFAYSSVKKRLAFVGSLLSFLFVILSLYFAYYKFNLDKNDKPGIVFSQESKVKSEPNLRSEESFRLHEGTKIQVLETVGEWKKIQLSDGTTGWIPSEDIRMLNDF